LDLFSDLNSASVTSIIIVSLVIGAISSVHCVGMCGSIMLATSKTIKQNYTYQFGRLFSYLILAFVISKLSQKMMGIYFNSIYISFVTFLIGAVFILFGLSKVHWFNINFNTKFKFLDKIYQYSLRTSLKFKSSSLKSFFIGASSILLPCGALYLFSFTLLSMVSFEYALIGIISFWVPTSIVLIFSAEMAKKIVQKKAPRNFQGAIYISLGVFTILYRFYLWNNLDKFCS